MKKVLVGAAVVVSLAIGIAVATSEAQVRDNAVATAIANVDIDNDIDIDIVPMNYWKAKKYCCPAWCACRKGAKPNSYCDAQFKKCAKKYGCNRSGFSVCSGTCK
jgi:hypothetical protein